MQCYKILCFDKIFIDSYQNIRYNDFASEQTRPTEPCGCIRTAAGLLLAPIVGGSFFCFLSYFLTEQRRIAVRRYFAGRMKEKFTVYAKKVRRDGRISVATSSYHRVGKMSSERRLHFVKVHSSRAKPHESKGLYHCRNDCYAPRKRA